MHIKLIYTPLYLGQILKKDYKDLGRDNARAVREGFLV